MDDTAKSMGLIPEQRDPNDRKDPKDPKGPKKTKDLDPSRRPWRLYLRRERSAMPKAMALLHTTAWVFLNEKDRKTLVDAIRSEVNQVLDGDLDHYPRGAQSAYEKLVMDAVCKVFSAHLRLFTFEGEDEPLVCELFDVPGAAEAAAELTAAPAMVAGGAAEAPGAPAASAAPGGQGPAGAAGGGGVTGVGPSAGAY